MDGDEWRGKGETGRVAVSEGSRRQMREMVAVMGERESEGGQGGEEAGPGPLILPRVTMERLPLALHG